MLSTSGVLMILFMSVTSGMPVVELTYSELSSQVNSGKIAVRISEALSSSGIMAVTKMPQEYNEAVGNLKRLAPSCIEAYQQFQLPDGSQRQTFALSSEQPEMYPECIRDASEVIAKHFDDVETLMESVITSLAGKDNMWWITNEGELGNFSSKGYKEHIHVYRARGENGDGKGYAAPFHTDNGLMLMITPFKEHPLIAKNRDGESIELNQVKEKFEW